MVRNIHSMLGISLLGSVLATAGPASAAAPSAMASGAPIDCATASTRMTEMMQAPGTAAMPAAGTVDKTFTTSMQMMMEHGRAMARMEVQCGKDARTRAEAQKLLDAMENYTQEVIDIDHHL